jgi:hypothetical protein
MSNDFESRLGVYGSGPNENSDFQVRRLSGYSFYPTRGRSYYEENWWDALSSLMQGSH